MQQSRNARLLQRCIQALSLALFFALLLLTVWPLAESWLPHDLYLRLDPLVALLAPVTAREWLGRLAPGLAVIAASIVFGRIFCGYLCPLGITLDCARWCSRFFFGNAEYASRPPLSPRWRWAKYLIFTAMAVAAILGVNLFFWGSPIALITRFYALLAHPLLLLAGSGVLAAGQPVFTALGADSLTYASLGIRRFDTLYFVLAFFLLLFVLERVRPRFWCRYLCPAGALLALAAYRPAWRRRVTRCTGCEQCVRQCPTRAIAAGGRETRYAECITCRSCVDVCPVRGVGFGCGAGSGEKETAQSSPDSPMRESGREPGFLPSRRAFIGAAGAGIVLTGVQYAGKDSFLTVKSLGNPWSETLVRPPGALPEPGFLDRCIRCGQCMKVCPTNALQPAWFEAGVEGMFSPVLVPRRGPCEPDCNACGAVCPTQAVTALALKEKHWAKIGTAVVLQQRCLAWAENKRCMVCQEVCPFGSVRVVQKAGQAVPVPVVDAARCFGCGYCEHHCPTSVPSIRVEPLNALRRDDGQFQRTARSLGYIFEPGVQCSPPDDGALLSPDTDLPPGFSP